MGLPPSRWNRAPGAQIQPFASPRPYPEPRCLGKLCAGDGSWPGQLSFPGRMKQWLPMGRGGAAVGVMGYLGPGRQLTVSGAAVGVLVSNFWGWWWLSPTMSPLPGPAVQSQPAQVHGQALQTGSSPRPDWLLPPFPSRRSPRVGWEPAGWLLGGGGRAGVEAGCTGRILPAGAGPASTVVPAWEAPVPHPERPGLWHPCWVLTSSSPHSFWRFAGCFRLNISALPLYGGVSGFGGV